MKISYWNWMAMVLVMLLIRMAPAIGGVHLSEIMADPARDWDGDGTIDSRGDEWLEVYNSGPGTFDLADFYVRDALGDDPQLQLSGSLAPGAAAVFYGSDAEAWQQDAGFGVTGLSRNNGGDQVDHAGCKRFWRRFHAQLFARVFRCQFRKVAALIGLFPATDGPASAA